MRPLATLRHKAEGSALIEFAICLPLLVVFLVGIYDFSGAFNQKQKMEHAAQARERSWPARSPWLISSRPIQIPTRCNR